jgi:hypothetical protein
VAQWVAAGGIQGAALREGVGGLLRWEREGGGRVVVVVGLRGVGWGLGI